MKVGKWVEEEDEQRPAQDSKVGSVSGGFQFDYSSGSSEVTFIPKSPAKSSDSGSCYSHGISSITRSDSSFEEYLEGLAAEILKENNV